MSIEKRIFVKAPSEIQAQVLDLAKRANAALARSAKLPAGDRTEALRFESLHAVIDQLGIAALANGHAHEVVSDQDGDDFQGPSVHSREFASAAPPTETTAKWIAEGGVVIELRLPHFLGATETGGQPGKGPRPSASRWMSRGRSPTQAVQERFEFLLQKAVDQSSAEAAVRPSGISNTVLTEGLRAYTCRAGNEPRVDAPVIYRDGSHGRPFPLRSLSMSETIPTMAKTLRFALMSIRHVELDVEVDGAWLRNTKVSQSRVAGLTDDIIFETSLRQLDRLTTGGSILIYMYQTGLETAILGFYRALVHHLLTHPNSVAVVPCFFHARGNFSHGTPWTTV